MECKSHKEVLKKLTSPDFEIDTITSSQLESIIFNNEKINDIIINADKSFIKDVLTASIIRFKNSRESTNSDDLTHPKYALNSTKQILYYNLLKRLSKYTKLLTNELDLLIDSNDDWLIETGFEMLNQSENEIDTSLIDKTLQIMRQNGMNHRPYDEGEFLASVLDKNSKLYDVIIAQFENENKNFKQAIFATFYICKQLPVEAEALTLKYIASNDLDLKNDAILASANCKVLRKEAISLLVNELNHEEYFIRGNAAGSLGRLKIEDPEIIMKITDLFGDIDGHDWNAQDAAITALGYIGKPAKVAVPMLVQLLQEELLNEYGSTEMDKLEICDVLGKIGYGTKDVINTLIDVCEFSKSIGVTGSLRALSRFGSKSKDVLPYVKKYVYEDEYLEGDYLTDDSAELCLLKSILMIDGPQSQMLKDYIEKLKASNHSDDRKIANSFEKSLEYR